jgi:hypothetical protein
MSEHSSTLRELGFVASDKLIQEKGTFFKIQIEGLGQKYEFAFCQRCLQWPGCPVAKRESTYLKRS